MKQQPKTVNLLLLLFVLVLILASVSSSLFGGRENAGLTYSGVLDLFEQEQVESFVLTGNSLALHLREPYKGSSDVTVKLGDVETFHADLDETIAAQKADGTLVSYNYLPSTTPWYRTVLPYIVGLGLIVLLWFFLAARANGGGPGGMAQFTHANARFGIPTNQTVTFQDVADCLVLVTNCFSTQTSYENQTKKAITNKFVQDAMTEFFRDRLHVYFIENKQEADRIADQVLVNKRSRESAEKARLNIKKKLTGSLDIANRVQKFVDCRTKDVSKREIYIVEGDSALGSVKLSRDAEFQGIMPVRGKILNCLKADYERIFKSDIITDLIRVLGCGVEVQTKKTKDLSAFDLENLRWNKVIICTDADVDGYQIRTLILTMIYRLCPTLIQEGYVYIAESPLYEITCKDKTWFAYTDAEKTEIVKKLEGKKVSINRSKGLGENDPEMMWMTTMNPATRRLIKVMPEDMARTMQIFDLLLGDNLQGRKDHIAENGYKYLDQLDVS